MGLLEIFQRNNGVAEANRYRVSIHADGVECMVDEFSPLPQKIEMMTLALALILQGGRRKLEDLTHVDFVDGTMDFFMQGSVVEGLRYGRVTVELTLVDEDGEPVPLAEVPAELPDSGPSQT